MRGRNLSTNCQQHLVIGHYLLVVALNQKMVPYGRAHMMRWEWLALSCVGGHLKLFFKSEKTRFIVAHAVERNCRLVGLRKEIKKKCQKVQTGMRFCLFI